MSILLTTPAFLLLLAGAAARTVGAARAGAAIAVLIVVLVNLMHFSQGWVQFGYRFSNDAVPFALPLVALGFERLVDGGRRWAMRWRPASSSSRSPSTRGAWPGATSSDGERPAGGPWRAAGRRRRLVGLSRSWRTGSTLLPGVGFWDTAELQAVAPLMGTAHPTGFPTYVLLGWLANLVLTPFGEPAFRMNLFAALCGRGRGRRHGRPRAALDALDRARDRGRAGPRPDPGSSGRSRRRAEAHALHLALLGDPPSGCSSAGRTRRDAGRPGGTAPPRRPLARRGRRRLRPVGRQPLADPAARPADRPVRARGRARHPAAAAVHRGLRRRARRHVALVYLELPLRAGPFRAPLVYGARRRGTASGTSCSPSSSGAASRPVRRPRRQAAAGSGRGRSPSSGRWPCSSRRLIATAIGRRATRC